MPQDKKLTEKRLSALWDDKNVPTLETKNKKYVLLSDVHLGDKGKADDFRHNQPTLERALDYYNQHRFTLMLLGDIEELWQFDLSKIRDKYNTSIYKKMRSFPDGRFYRIWGNHDSEWGVPNDPARDNQGVSNVAEEAIKLKDQYGLARIMLVHGNQGSVESDKSSWASRFFVRLYKYVEPVIKVDPHTSATKSQIPDNYEKTLYEWAKKTKTILICGHSHRAIFASRSYWDKLDKNIRKLQKEVQDNRKNKKIFDFKMKELEKLINDKIEEEVKKRKVTSLEKKGKPLPCYFNTGCALFTDGVTTIEIENDEIRLVKWHRKVRNGTQITVFDKGVLSDFVKKTVG